MSDAWKRWPVTSNINGDLFIALSDNCIYVVRFGRLSADAVAGDIPGRPSFSEEPRLEHYAGIPRFQGSAITISDGNRLGAALFGKISGMDAVADEKGRIWLADEVAQTIRFVSDKVYTAAGVPVTSSGNTSDGLVMNPQAAENRIPRDGDANSEAVFCSPHSVLYIPNHQVVVVTERGRRCVRLLDLAKRRVTTVDFQVNIPSNLNELRLSSTQLHHFPGGPFCVRLYDFNSAVTYNLNLRTGKSTLIDSNLQPVANFVRKGRLTTLWYGKHSNWLNWDYGFSYVPTKDPIIDSAKSIDWCIHDSTKHYWTAYAPRHNVFIRYHDQKRCFRLSPVWLKILPDPFSSAGLQFPNGLVGAVGPQAALGPPPGSPGGAPLGPTNPYSLPSSSSGFRGGSPLQTNVAEDFAPPPRAAISSQPGSSFLPTSSQHLAHSAAYAPFAPSSSSSSLIEVNALAGSLSDLPPLPSQSPFGSSDGSRPLNASPALDVPPSMRLRLARIDLSDMLTNSPIVGDVLVKHGFSGETWLLHSEVLKIHFDGDCDFLTRALAGTFMPRESVFALILAMYCQPLSNPKDLQKSALMASHVIFLWRQLGLFNIDALYYEFATTIVSQMPAEIACASLLDIWSDDLVTWELTDEIVLILTSFVRERCRAEFLSFASDSKLVPKRLVPLVSVITTGAPCHSLRMPTYVPALPEVRLSWRKTRSELEAPVSSAPATSEAPVDNAESLIRHPTDFVFGFDETSEFRHCWIVASAVYVWPQWNFFRRLLESSLAEASSRVVRMPSWVTASILLSILNMMHHTSAPSFILTNQEALTLLEHARELELVDTLGVPLGSFVPLLQKCYDHSFPPWSETNILSHYANFHRLGMDTKMTELASELVRADFPSMLTRIARELNSEQIVDLFLRISTIQAKQAARKHGSL